MAHQLVHVQQIHASEGAFAAIKEDGTVVTWGNSSAGGDCSAVEADLVDLHRIHAASGAFAAVRNDGQVPFDTLSQNGKSPDVYLRYLSSEAQSFRGLSVDGQVVTWGDPWGGGDSGAVHDRLRP